MNSMDDEAAIVNSGPRVAEARHAAKALLRSSKIKDAPVMLNTVIKLVPSSYKLVVRGTKNPEYIPTGCDAFTYRDNSMTAIGYDARVAPVRQKFSVAHELGHLYMGHVHGGSSIDLDSTNNDEIEANKFAAQLIMPPEMLRKDIKSGIKEVKDLAKRYVVSEEALWWQITNSGLLKLL